ncbi:MAG TPA: aromatic amino acid hydroxylase [candidate division Zixibacteria bacterium]|nr:aromatic amino acid hydroxylase [candidate division Zixibacteria bacterium]
MNGNQSSPNKYLETSGESDFFIKLQKNPAIQKLPKHLRQFIVDQNYAAYTPIDHSVWRYVLRQNYRFLIEHAHEIYFEGLEKTGLKLVSIPSIEEMNDILSKIGWGAVSVDGFIPPAAFMEFQQYRVLVIAADMRQINHIEYTPSPDIIHEAAGHAPVIADPEYAEYLRRFGEIGAKAMSSKKDFELYEAIRKLSILKETPGASQDEISVLEKDVLSKQENLGEPSEMARLTRLHWWTVEYGLVGTLDAPKIYGAGILSSIGEASTCLSDDVKKIKYDLSAQNYAFDITTKQPHLFVTDNFTTLIDILEQFADQMAFRVGGLQGIRQAIESENTSTLVFSSAIQVSGICTNVITDNSNKPIFLKTTGKTNLAVENKELDGHSIDYHKDGFSSPIGNLLGSSKPFEDFDKDDLNNFKIIVGNKTTLEFESGIVVKGLCSQIKLYNSKLILITFKDCTVTYNNEILFEPSWGTYDMAVGSKIISIFSGAADKNAYEQPTAISKTRVNKVTYTDKDKELHKLYQNIRDYREGKKDILVLKDVWQSLKSEHKSDWLLAVEILEIVISEKTLSDLESDIRSYLEKKVSDTPNLQKLIIDGINLADNPLKNRVNSAL